MLLKQTLYSYTEWYDHQQELSFNSDSVYYYDNPGKLGFSFPFSSPEKILDGFLAESRLPGSTCESICAKHS